MPALISSTVAARPSIRASSRRAVRACARQAGAPEAAAAAALAAATLLPLPASASELGSTLKAAVEDLDSKLDVLESGVEQVAGAASQAYGAASAAAGAAAPVAGRVADAAAPVLSAAGSLASRTLGPALEQVEKSASGAASSALSSAGVDASAVASSASKLAGETVDLSKEILPLASEAAQGLSSVDAGDVVTYAVLGAAGFVGAQLLLDALFSGLRGYAGDLRPVEALDAVAEGAVIVDVRRADEIAKGAVDLPRGQARRLLTLPREKLIGGGFKDVGRTEASLTALKIGALKEVGRGTKVILMDQSGRDAKAVAKALDGNGFGKVYVLAGGFSNWQASGLKTRETQQPKGLAGTMFTGKATQVAPKGAKALPAGRR